MVVLMGDEERGLAFLFCERIVRWVNTDRIVSIAYSFSSKWSLTLYFLLSVAIGGFTSPLSSLYLNKLVLFLQLLDRFEFFGMSDGFMMMINFYSRLLYRYIVGLRHVSGLLIWRKVGGMFWFDW